jgi:hypothetical protein
VQRCRSTRPAPAARASNGGLGVVLSAAGPDTLGVEHCCRAGKRAAVEAARPAAPPCVTSIHRSRLGRGAAVRHGRGASAARYGCSSARNGSPAPAGVSYRRTCRSQRAMPGAGRRSLSKERSRGYDRTKRRSVMCAFYGHAPMGTSGSDFKWRRPNEPRRGRWHLLCGRVARHHRWRHYE